MDQEHQPKQQSGTVNETPEISLSMSDDQILALIQRKLDENRKLLEVGKDPWSRLSVTQRADRNVRYWRGSQDGDSRIGMPRKRYRNNIIHRDLATRVQNATSRMPDVVVMSPQQDEDPSVKDQTRKVEEWLNIRVDSDVMRRLAQSALRDNHLKFRGIWGYRYDKFRRDAVIERLRPEDVVLDATARIPEDGYTCDNMEFIGEWCEDYTASVMAMFPKKASELADEIGRESDANGQPRSSKIRYLKSTIRSSNKDGSPSLILAYSYNRILLDAVPHPYWDGREKPEERFGLVPEGRLHPEINEMLPELGLDKQGPPEPKRLNHFPWPRMPYSVFSGENLGDGPLDDTTVVEQAIPLQDIVNERGDQITQTNDWAVPKTAISTRAMTSEKASNITRAADEVITVKLEEPQQTIQGEIMTFSGLPASPAMYQDLQQAIQAIDAHFSTSAAVRGEAVEPESGISKQISREGDLSTSDDLAQTMLQRCVEEAANWLVQLAKIYFDEPTAALSPGSDGSLKSASISSKLVPDNIQVVVKANAVDKMTMRNISMNLIQAQAIDPMSFNEDQDFPNPKERTKRLVDWLNRQNDGGASYLADIGIQPGTPASSQNEATQGGVPPQGAPTPAASPPAQPQAPVPPAAPIQPPAPPQVPQPPH